MARRKKKSSTSSKQASLPLAGRSKPKRIAVVSYTRSFSASKLPPRDRAGKWRKKR